MRFSPLYEMVPSRTRHRRWRLSCTLALLMLMLFTDLSKGQVDRGKYSEGFNGFIQQIERVYVSRQYGSTIRGLELYSTDVYALMIGVALRRQKEAVRQDSSLRPKYNLLESETKRYISEAAEISKNSQSGSVGIGEDVVLGPPLKADTLWRLVLVGMNVAPNQNRQQMNRQIDSYLRSDPNASLFWNLAIWFEMYKLNSDDFPVVIREYSTAGDVKPLDTAPEQKPEPVESYDLSDYDLSEYGSGGGLEETRAIELLLIEADESSEPEPETQRPKPKPFNLDDICGTWRNDYGTLLITKVGTDYIGKLIHGTSGAIGGGWKLNEVCLKVQFEEENAVNCFGTDEICSYEMKYAGTENYWDASFGVNWEFESFSETPEERVVGAKLSRDQEGDYLEIGMSYFYRRASR